MGLVWCVCGCGGGVSLLGCCGVEGLRGVGCVVVCGVFMVRWFVLWVWCSVVLCGIVLLCCFGFRVAGRFVVVLFVWCFGAVWVVSVCLLVSCGFWFGGCVGGGLVVWGVGLFGGVWCRLGWLSGVVWWWSVVWWRGVWLCGFVRLCLLLVCVVRVVG